MGESNNKGYIRINLKKAGEDKLYLQEIGFSKKEDDSYFYVDYCNGEIFISWADTEKPEIIGYYEQKEKGLANVYDDTKSRVIGSVGDGLIYFRKKDPDPSVGRYLPEEECLAWYSEHGSITPTTNKLCTVGVIHDTASTGGAAAFVAIFHAYKFRSLFRDFFEMDFASFKDKHKKYLDATPFELGPSPFVEPPEETSPIQVQPSEKNSEKAKSDTTKEYLDIEVSPAEEPLEQEPSLELKDEGLKQSESNSFSLTKDTGENTLNIQQTKKNIALVRFLILFPYTGLFGVHDLYLGKKKLGLIKLCTVNFLVFGWIWDIIQLLLGTYAMTNGSETGLFSSKQKYTGEELRMLGVMNLIGYENVPVNKTLAAEYFERGVQMGDAGCQYHLGCMYNDGNGVARTPQKAYLLIKQAAESDFKDAKRLLEEFERMDALNRVGLSMESLEGYMSLSTFGADGIDDAKEHYSEAISAYSRLYNPSDENKEALCRIYTGLGFAAYLTYRKAKKRNDLDEAYHLYSQGRPLSKTRNERFVIGAAMMLDTMWNETKNNLYRREYVATLKEIYEECFDILEDYDFRIYVLDSYAKELCRGVFCKKDRVLARKFAEKIREIGEQLERGELQKDEDAMYKDVMAVYRNLLNILSA